MLPLPHKFIRKSLHEPLTAMQGDRNSNLAAMEGERDTRDDERRCDCGDEGGW